MCVGSVCVEKCSLSAAMLDRHLNLCFALIPGYGVHGIHGVHGVCSMFPEKIYCYIHKEKWNIELLGCCNICCIALGIFFIYIKLTWFPEVQDNYHRYTCLNIVVDGLMLNGDRTVSAVSILMKCYICINISSAVSLYHVSIWLVVSSLTILQEYYVFVQWSKECIYVWWEELILFIMLSHNMTGLAVQMVHYFFQPHACKHLALIIA